jgi:hypothetical protein
MKMTARLCQAWAAGLLLMLALGTGCRAQMVTGSAMAGYGAALGLQPGAASDYAVHLVSSSVPGNILWPGDRVTFTFQVVSTSAGPIRAAGHVQVIPYGTRGAPGDTWDPHVVRTGTPVPQPVTISLAPNGFQDVTVTPATPARFGGYALVLDLGPLGRQFITSYVRSLPATSRRVEYPHMCLDSLPPPVLQRLGVHAIRYGMGYKPTTDPDFAQWYAARGKELRAYQAAGVTVLYMVGGPDDWGGPTQPLHHQRPWLDDRGVMQEGKFDLAWLPSYDADFQEYCHRLARDYGWPRGPITAFSLWNEPWEGVSISGWGADMLRYREMYTHMWRGVNEARREGAVVLVGGGDSSTNAMDKLFPDNTDTFGPMFDFLSVHYQGLTSTANYKPWVDRKGYGGRVKIWDTESGRRRPGGGLRPLTGHLRRQHLHGERLRPAPGGRDDAPGSHGHGLVHGGGGRRGVELHRRAPLPAAAVLGRPPLGDGPRRSARRRRSGGPRGRHGGRGRRSGRGVRREHPAPAHGTRLRRGPPQGRPAGATRGDDRPDRAAGAGDTDRHA